jgi:hypothetical protein
MRRIILEMVLEFMMDSEMWGGAGFSLGEREQSEG